MRTILPLLAALALAGGVAADHCSGWTAHQPELTVEGGPTGQPARYVAVDFVTNAQCCFSIWIYEESNGIEGLQREDFMQEDTCHGLIEPDTLIF